MGRKVQGSVGEEIRDWRLETKRNREHCVGDSRARELGSKGEKAQGGWGAAGLGVVVKNLV